MYEECHFVLDNFRFQYVAWKVFSLIELFVDYIGLSFAVPRLEPHLLSTFSLREGVKSDDLTISWKNHVTRCFRYISPSSAS